MNQLFVPKDQSGIHLKTFLMQWGLSASYWKALKKLRLFLSMASSQYGISRFQPMIGSVFLSYRKKRTLPRKKGLLRFFMKTSSFLPFIRSKDCLSITAVSPKSPPYPAAFSSITGNMISRPPFIRFPVLTVKQAASFYLPKMLHSIICSPRLL